MRHLTDPELARAWRSKWWLSTRPRYALAFQLRQERLAMPWEHFRSALDTVLGRPVGRRELDRANRRRLLDELGDALAPVDLEWAELHVVQRLDELGVTPGAFHELVATESQE